MNLPPIPRTNLSAPQRRALLATPWGWIACGFGSGLAPVAPGTFGSLASILPYLLLRELPLWVALLITLAVFWLGVLAADAVETLLSRKDPGLIVIDEWVGQWLTLLLLERAPVWLPGIAAPLPLWAMLLLGFVLFRACDVAKPWPASAVDRGVAGGLGTMLDDAIAALWAAVLGGAVLVALARF
jgi:phosphatidylglycerophosphatase A